MKKISFHVIDVDRGQILFRFTKGILEVWTIADGCGDMCYQFGCHVKNLDDAKSLILANYKNHNLSWFV